MKKTALLFLCLVLSMGASAGISLPEIIGDNMVLQQSSTVNLWGCADPASAVTVTPSWGGKYVVKSDVEGRWVVPIQTPTGGYEPQQIVIAGKSRQDTVVLKNILIGEVWFAGGQSNMEMPLGGFTDCPVSSSNDIVAQAASKRNKLRYVKIPFTPSYEPQERVAGKWNECVPSTVARFTAVGYFFAEMLNDILDVPVGIIDCSRGGSAVEAWLGREVLAGYSGVDLSREGVDKMPQGHRPMSMFNGMLNPLTNYTVKGFLWYQGESNVAQHADYVQRFSDMTRLWRSRWKQGDLPFYYVEIAPYRHYGEHQGAYLREAQYKAQSLIPNSCMVCTNDLVEPYEAGNIHPREKRQIGRRLAYCALNRDYGLPEVACEGPQFESVAFSEGKAVVCFTHADGGFNRMEGIEGFEICGSDNVFYPAQVQTDGGRRRVLLSSPSVAAPVAVRYGFGNYLPGNLGNLHNLPLVPFRTDNH